MMAGGAFFDITVTGRGSHGALRNNGSTCLSSQPFD
jgi:hypothetical protein